MPTRRSNSTREAPAAHEVAATNTTVNKLLGGKQPAWMTSNQVQPSHRPERRTRASAAPQLPQQPGVLPAGSILTEPILPSPAPSDEPSPAVSNTHDSPNSTSARLAEDQTMDSTTRQLPVTEARFVPAPAVASAPVGNHAQQLPFGQLPSLGGSGSTSPATTLPSNTTPTTTTGPSVAPGVMSSRAPSVTIPQGFTISAPQRNTSAAFSSSGQPMRQGQGTSKSPIDRDTDPDARASKRRRTEPGGIAQLAHQIDLYTTSVGGMSQLSRSVESPRFSLLKQACLQDDIFFVVLHQIYCASELSSVSQRESTYQVLRVSSDQFNAAIQILDQLLRPNQELDRKHCQFFAGFPGIQLADRPIIARKIGAFLRRLPGSWAALMGNIASRGYPLLMDELVVQFECSSPTLQNIMFTCSRRRLGINDSDPGTPHDRNFARMVQQMFTDDQRTNWMSQPEDDQMGEWLAGMTQRNAERIGQYRFIVQKSRELGQPVPRRDGAFSPMPLSPATSNPQSPALPQGLPSPALQQGFPSSAFQHNQVTRPEQVRRATSLSSSSNGVARLSISSPAPDPQLPLPTHTLASNATIPSNTMFPQGSGNGPSRPAGNAPVPRPGTPGQPNNAQQMLQNAGRLASMQRQQAAINNGQLQFQQQAQQQAFAQQHQQQMIAQHRQPPQGQQQGFNQRPPQQMLPQFQQPPQAQQQGFGQQHQQQMFAQHRQPPQAQQQQRIMPQPQQAVMWQPHPQNILSVQQWLALSQQQQGLLLNHRPAQQVLAPEQWAALTPQQQQAFLQPQQPSHQYSPVHSPVQAQFPGQPQQQMQNQFNQPRRVSQGVAVPPPGAFAPGQGPMSPQGRQNFIGPIAPQAPSPAMGRGAGFGPISPQAPSPAMGRGSGPSGASVLQRLEASNPSIRNMMNRVREDARRPQQNPAQRSAPQGQIQPLPQFSPPSQPVQQNNANSRRPLLPAKGAQIARHQWPYDPTDPKSVLMSLHQAQARSPKRSRADGEPLTDRFYQSVKTMAAGPAIIEPRDAMYSFEFEVSREEYDLLSKPVTEDKSLVPHRNFFNGSLRYRIRCAASKSRSAKDVKTPTDSEWVIMDSAWPKSIFIHFNGKPLTIRRAPHHGKDQAIELTDKISVGKNVLKVSIMKPRPDAKDPRPEPIHILGIEVVETRSHSWLIEHILEQGFDDPEVTKSKLKARLGGAGADDDEVSFVQKELSIDLTDPFSASMWKIPARGAKCTHMECFDLETWLSTRPNKPAPMCQHKQQPCKCDKTPEPSIVDKWKCPVASCSGDARPYSLRIDGFMLAVRRQLEKDGKLNTKAILVSADGAWNPVEEPDDDGGSDGEGPAPRARSTPRPKENSRPPAEVIELD